MTANYLPEVSFPRSWELRPLKFLLQRKSERGRPDQELLSVYRDYGVIPKNSRDDNFNKPSADLSSYLYVREGDLVVNKMKAWQGSLGVAEIPGIVSPAYFTYEVASCAVPRFLHFQLRSQPYIALFRRLSKGIRPNQWDLDPDAFGRVLCGLPPAQSHQAALVSFLDRRTVAIDELIEKKERLVELLEEKRTALIHRAVTKGLDPSVPMKNSGVPWVDEIPSHWVECQLRRAVRSAVYGTSERLLSQGETPVLRMNNIQEGGLDLGDLSYLNEIEERLLLRRGDLLFNRTNSWDLVGKAALVGDSSRSLSFASYLVRIRLKPKVADSGFFSYLMNSPAFLAQARSVAIPSISQANLSASSYLSLSLALPPKREQVEIAEFLSGRLGDMYRLETALEQQKCRLEEYRQAVIAAAVTGQLIDKDVGEVDVTDEESAG